MLKMAKKPFDEAKRAEKLAKDNSLFKGSNDPRLPKVPTITSEKADKIASSQLNSYKSVNGKE